MTGLSFRFGLVLFLALCAAELIAILVQTGGAVLFTLDDAYVHFSLAENLLAGHYGVNPGEASSPSSSILWPFLIAPFFLTPFPDWIVLLVNLGFALATLHVQFRIVSLVFEPVAARMQRRHRAVAYTIVAFLIPITNLVGLVFTGMEHSLQVWLAHLVVWGVIEHERSGRLPAALVAGLLLAPFVRYESLALTAPGLAYLAFRGRVGAAAAIGAGVALGIGLFSLFLHAQGLGYLPSSIVAKAAVASGEGSLERVAANLARNLSNRFGWTLLLLSLGCVPALFRARHAPYACRPLAALLAAAGLLHLVAGDLWWYGRYETYVLSALVLGLLFLYREGLTGFVTRRSAAASLAAVGVPLFLLSTPSLFILATTPTMTGEIYRQPYQFHRLATQFYPRPVAITDLGWVSFRNEGYVLDLWGLASRKALDCRLADDTPACLQELMREYDVGLVMVTDTWFEELPEQWIRLGVYDRGGWVVKKFADTIGVAGFYVTDAKYLPEARAAVAAFRETLPPPAEFTFEDERVGAP